ncbi:MAG: VOC family protein [Planctomycetota bacterium]
MNTNPVVWFEIYVQDMDRAKAFYEKVLGKTLDKLDSPDPSMLMYNFPMDEKGAGAAGALCKMGDVPSGPGGTMVYFHCDDVANEIGRVAEAGGVVKQEKMSIGPYGFIAMALDTEGNMIGFHSQA